MKRLLRMFRLGRRRTVISRDRKKSTRRKIAVAVVTALVLILIPSGSASAAPADFNWTDLNPLGAVNDSACASPSMGPEVYGSGFDGLAGGSRESDASYYGQYGTAGQYWNWYGEKCTDFSMPIGNEAANVIFSIAKTIDTVTITVYQSAVDGSIVSWLKNMSDKLIHSIGNALQVGYVTLVIVIGALALIWWGLFKRRATKVTEGAVWMVCAMVAFLALINRPELFTTAGSWVTGGTQSVLEAALSSLQDSGATGGVSHPVPDSVINGKRPAQRITQSATICIPTNAKANNPQYKSTNWTTGKNSQKWDDTSKSANTMWSVLVCKPWLQGEFGTADPSSFMVQSNADKLLQSQAFSKNQLDKARKSNPNAINSGVETKMNQFHSVAERVKTENGNTALFSGEAYPQRIGIAFAALFAAIVAGLLILLLSLALIIFKLGFLLLLITGPVFLLIGIHPGWGKVIAIRWVELLLSTLLKQALIAGLLALLLFLYALIMGAPGLSWVIQIVLIAMVSFAAFFYRKPFQHLFAAVGTDSIGSRILSNATTRGNVVNTANPLAVSSRVNRWALRKAQPVTNAAAAATGHPGAVGAALASRIATGDLTADDVSGRTAERISAGGKNGDGSGPSTGTSRRGGGNRAGTNAPPLNLPRPGENNQSGPGTTPRGGVRPGGGPTAVGPRSGPGSGNTPVGAGWGPRPGEAPPIWKPSSSSGTPPRNTPALPAPTSSGGGSGSRSGAGGWSGSSWRRSGGAAAGPSGPNGPEPPNSGGNNGPRRGGGGGGGWFGGGSSRRDGGSYDPPAPPRRGGKRDNSPGPPPWRKREGAPPLWAKPSKPPAPDIPFWTRPDK